MNDPRVNKLADLLTKYCVAVQPGDKVVIMGAAAVMPALTATYRAVLRAGGHPTVLWQDHELEEILLKEGSDEQLRRVDPVQLLVTETYDCRIFISGGSNTRALSNVPTGRQAIYRRAQSQLLDIRMRRSAAGEMRWVGSMFPTNAQAQEADMSLSEYEEFVYRACFLDQPDPVAAWRAMSADQQRLVDWLQGKEQVRVQGPHADLTLSIAGRAFINSDGRRNMPSGEIFTGPVEESVNGWVQFTYPAIYQGQEVDGIELRFDAGKVVEATAKKGAATLHSALDTDAGARFLGEFAIGTNDGIDRFTKSILFDEKIGGTFHLAVGAGYPETGSRNRSAIHWDMICDMRDGGQIWVDDELFYDSGRFLLPGSD